MSSKKRPSFPFVVIAFVLAGGIFEEFNFESMEFEKPALAIVYILTFLMTLYFITKGLKSKS